jgi:hypothetical protein
VASSYGLARYTYGLFIPVFREALQVDDASLAFIAAFSLLSTLWCAWAFPREAPRLFLLALAPS